MPAEQKPPYKLTIKLSGARPERIAEALQALQECCSAHDQTGETGATAVIECWKEQDAREVADAFEDWQYRHAIGLESTMDLHRPGIRPETMARRMREKHATPMDDLLGDGVDSVTLSSAGRSVTLTAETGARAKEWAERTQRLHGQKEGDTMSDMTGSMEWLEAQDRD